MSCCQPRGTKEDLRRERHQLHPVFPTESYALVTEMLMRQSLFVPSLCTRNHMVEAEKRTLQLCSLTFALVHKRKHTKDRNKNFKITGSFQRICYQRAPPVFIPGWSKSTTWSAHSCTASGDFTLSVGVWQNQSGHSHLKSF